MRSGHVERMVEGMMRAGFLWGDVGLDGSIILKRIFQKLDGEHGLY
jgi:hypothetical protein